MTSKRRSLSNTLVYQQVKCLWNEGPEREKARRIECDVTHVGMSSGLGVGADTSSNVFGHAALVDCVLAY